MYYIFDFFIYYMDNNLPESVLAYTNLTYAVTPITETVLKMVMNTQELLKYYEKGVKKLMENKINLKKFIKNDIGSIYNICAICRNRSSKLISQKSMIYSYLKDTIRICECCKYIDNEAYKLLVALSNIANYILTQDHLNNSKIDPEEILREPNYISSICYYNLFNNEITVKYRYVYSLRYYKLSLLKLEKLIYE